MPLDHAHGAPHERRDKHLLGLHPQLAPIFASLIAAFAAVAGGLNRSGEGNLAAVIVTLGFALVAAVLTGICLASKPR